MATEYSLTIDPRLSYFHEAAMAIMRQGQPEGSTTVYCGRRNKLFYVEPGGECGSGILNPLPFPVNVKAFRVPPFPNDFVYRALRPGKAKRSYDNARRLLEMNFLTPQPVGYGEIHTGLINAGIVRLMPRLTRSYYFCEQLALKPIRDWEGRADVEQFTAAFGAEIARLHRAGVWFHDFSPGNILVDDSTAGVYRFYYVDLNRMEFGVTNKRKLMQMFSSISWHPEWAERLGKAYAVAAGLDIAATGTEARRESERWREHFFRKDRYKQLLAKKIGLKL